MISVNIRFQNNAQCVKYKRALMTNSYNVKELNSLELSIVNIDSFKSVKYLEQTVKQLLPKNAKVILSVFEYKRTHLYDAEITETAPVQHQTTLHEGLGFYKKE